MNERQYGEVSTSGLPVSTQRRRGEDINKSKVVRELSPQRVYGKNVEMHRIQAPALFTHPEHLKCLRPLVEDSSEYMTTPVRKPKLLQRLEATLDRKLATAEKMSSAYGPVRAGWAASMLRLDAYRQAFEALVNSMTTYKPILTKIKQEYDLALEDALRSSYENIHMRADLAVSEVRLGKAVDSALQESAQGAAQLRDDLMDQLASKEKRALAAEADASAMESEARNLRDQLTHLSHKASELLRENQAVRAQMLLSSSLRSGEPSAVKAAK